MAKEGLILVLIGLVVAVALLWSANKWDNHTMFAFSLLAAALTMFVVFFFRDPERTITPPPEAVVSPADGKILAIEEMLNHPYAGARAVKVSIFLSIFDVHVNRVPVSGVVEYVNYNRGKFFAAFQKKASELNEQTEIGMTDNTGRRVVVRQIAGFIARRIVCHLKVGDRVTVGDRFGMIRFGSRTELILPSGTRIEGRPGDHVRGGSSIIGYLDTLSASPSAAGAEGGENAH